LAIFDIPNAQRLDPGIQKSFGEIRYMRRHTDQPEYIELRASGLPLCPKAYVIYRRLPASRRPRKEETFISDSAAWMGTALHQALQKWFGLHGQLHGDWVCVHCKKIRRNKTGTQKCRSCGREMIYHEFEIARGKHNPLSGHIDGILKVPTPYLIDFKGSSLPAIRDLKQNNKPKESHYLQVNAYANVVNMNLKRYGLSESIKKVIIIYVDRGKPWQTWLPLQVPVSKKLFLDVVGRIQLAQECLKTGRIPRGLCVNTSDDYGTYCPWRTVCFSPALDGILSRDIEAEGLSKGVSDQELLLLASFLNSH